MNEKNLVFKNLNYIDALRAFSLLIVILFHLNQELFFFGYLGVDIFFVISGYVITNSLYKDQIIKKKNLSSFYVKRLKRIFPILFLVILSFLFFYLLLSPLDGKTNYIFKSAISALLGVSNLYFLNNKFDYFFNDQINPLLHTWSLGIEEQFYLIYPIFIIIAFKFLKDNKKIYIFILFFILLSLIIYYFNDGFIGNFYSPLARFWELGIGCLAFFYYTIPIKKRKLIIILFLLLFVFIIINNQNEKELIFRSYIAAVGSFFLIIKLKIYNNKVFYDVLNKTKMPYLGKLSYSLYLWHLPVLYFSKIYFSGIILYVVFFTTSFSLSILSFHFYEDPIRRFQFHKLLQINFIKNFKHSIIIFLFFLLLGVYYISSNLNYEALKRFNYPEKKLKVFLSRLDHNYQNYLDAKCTYENNVNFIECFKNGKIKNSFYITGDSHASPLVVTLDNTEFTNHYFMDNFAHCLLILNSLYIDANKSMFYENCDKNYNKKNYRQFIIEKFKKSQNNYIFLSIRLSEYLEDNWKIRNDIKENKVELIINNYQKFINLFPNKNFILFSTVPESKIITEKCIFNEFLSAEIDKKIFDKCHFYKADDQLRYNKVKNILKRVESNNSNVKIYDPYNFLCPTNTCHNYNKKQDFVMLQDNNHMSIEASKLVSKDFDFFLKKNYK